MNAVASVTDCPACKGVGGWLGTCPNCGGSGKVSVDFLERCRLCGTVSSWRAPGQRGVMQGWYRRMENGRCADRGACKTRREAR